MEDLTLRAIEHAARFPRVHEFTMGDRLVDDQIQRGAYYRDQIDQLTDIPYVLGASLHAWSDRYLAASEAP